MTETRMCSYRIPRVRGTLLEQKEDCSCSHISPLKKTPAPTAGSTPCFTSAFLTIGLPKHFLKTPGMKISSFQKSISLIASSKSWKQFIVGLCILFNETRQRTTLDIGKNRKPGSPFSNSPPYTLGKEQEGKVT